MNITGAEIAILEAATSDDTWNAACSIIKKTRNGSYPPDWWPTVIQSGLADRIMAKWGGDMNISVSSR